MQRTTLIGMSLSEKGKAAAKSHRAVETAHAAYQAAMRARRKEVRAYYLEQRDAGVPVTAMARDIGMSLSNFRQLVGDLIHGDDD